MVFLIGLSHLQGGISELREPLGRQFPPSPHFVLYVSGRTEVPCFTASAGKETGEATVMGASARVGNATGVWRSCWTGFQMT